jgi:hypothetical protein
MSENEESKLDRTLNLLALIALKEMGQKEQIDLLDRAGFGQKQIAEFVQSTPKAVSVRLAEIRKARKSKSDR